MRRAGSWSTLSTGVNLIDCANVYGPLDDERIQRGWSEEVLGQILQGRRGDLVVTSKVSAPVGDGPNDWGTSRYQIMREVERSLRRLNTDYIDLYLLHVYDPTTPLEESMRAMDDLVTQGKARYVGCSLFQAWHVCKVLWTANRIGADLPVCVERHYNLLNRGAEKEMFGLVRDTGLGLLAIGPLAVGFLSGAYRPGQSPPPGTLWATRRRDQFQWAMSRAAPVIETVSAIAEQWGKSPAQVALNWVLSQPEVTAAVCGSDTYEQMDDNLGAVGWELGPGELRRLDEVSQGMELSLGKPW